MKIYIASRTARREEVKKINNLFKDKGYEVLDWTWHKYIKPYFKNKKLAKDYAIEDIQNIKESDIFIFLADKTFGAGSTTELGSAIAFFVERKKPKIYVVGDNSANLFYYHPAINYRNSVVEIIEEM